MSFFVWLLSKREQAEDGALQVAEYEAGTSSRIIILIWRESNRWRREIRHSSGLRNNTSLPCDAPSAAGQSTGAKPKAEGSLGMLFTRFEADYWPGYAKRAALIQLHPEALESLAGLALA